MTTTWKERGIVPDSDEEDDTVDSQHTWNSDDHGNLEGMFHVKPAIIAVEIGTADLHDRSLPIQKTLIPSVCGNKTETQQPTSSANVISQGLVGGKLLAEIPPRTQTQNDTSTNQSVNLKARELLQPLSSQGRAMVMRNLSCLEGADEEEICRSYVGLSSPTSSLSSLSSLFSTPSQCPPGARIQPSGNDEQIGVPNEAQVPTYDEITHQEMSIFCDINNYESTKRRSFRPRTQIQLHPYLMDSERHRREFMARGLRPMRFTQAQQMAQNAPQNGNSQDTEFEVEEDSQNTGIEYDHGVTRTSQNLLSSPTLSSGSALEHNNRPQSISSSNRPARVDAEEDEFPDIDDLVEQARKDSLGMRRTGNIGHKRTYCKAHSGRRDSQPESNTCRNIAPTHVDSFDELQSPPLTSSPIPPFPNWAGDMRETPSRRESDITEKSTIKLDNARMDLGVTELPTPAASSAKRANGRSAEVNVHNENPFISSNEAEEFQSSPPKGPGNARKLLRGVLPASHIRINTRTQAPQPNAPRSTVSDSINHSSVLPDIRRGIALPRITDEMAASADVDPRAGLYFLSDESDEDDFGIQGVVMELNENSHAFLSQSDFGLAIEDNRIDPMITSKKRQRSFFSQTGIRKKRRVVTSLFKATHGNPYQPRISEVFSDSPRAPLSTQRNVVNKNSVQSLAQEVSEKIKSRSRPSQLGIQEVMPQFSEPVTYLPMFIRIAARTAGSRHSLGRLGPTKKFVRLDNREDTIDAQTILRLWKGKSAKSQPPTQSSRSPLRAISENTKNQTSLWTDNFKNPLEGHITLKRGRDYPKVRVTNHQTKISWASTNPQIDPHIRLRNNRRKGAYSERYTSHRGPATYSALQPRSAQLEVSEADYGNRDRRSAFGSTKRNLDKLYKRYQNGSSAETNIPLARFLADKGPIGNTIGTLESPVRNLGGDKIVMNDVDEHLPQAQRQRKRTPKQMDATAARYRQPEKPVIIPSIDTPTSLRTIQDTGSELYGLGGSDTNYSVDFDVFPLRSGIYFHESTFIGKGKLAKALRTESSRYHDHTRGYASCQFGTQYVRWGMWDVTVSSEIGICFNWIVSRLHSFVSTSLDTLKSNVDKDAVQCMQFMVDYFQDTLTFQDHEEPNSCLLRMTEVMESLTQCLEVLSRSLDSRDDINNRRIMNLSIFEVVLIFQTLRISATQVGNINQHTTNQLETLLQRAAITSVKLLFIVGLSSVQSLYDGLQYLATREAGIKSCETPAQAWVILMHIMHAARIPRVSFWDAVNLHLLENINIESDARVLEKTWYSMLSLLPLMEFNEFGVLVPRSRYRATSENWTLPQKIAKRLFELYTSNPKQPPNFNNYCRTIFSRCHHLIQVWGWRRYGPIVGTFFDFFASHGFSHIGSEVPYTSPEFLQDLDGALSSAIEPEDQCFHIFLKIIHSAIRQLHEASEAKEIRNLVTRLLPNHDLEYQKDPTKATSIGSLRNHHDLLFTLYWAAPSELRHKISIMLDLVDQERSKREAYLRNAKHQRR